MNIKLRQTLLFLLLMLITPVSMAHISDSHVMSVVEGLMHFVAYADHVLLLMPIMLFVLGWFYKEIT